MGFLLRALLLVGLVILMGGGRCKSVDTTVRVEKTKEGLNRNDSLFERSNLTPEEKAEGKKNNENARVLITDQNTDIQKKAKEIQRLEWYEDIFWQGVIALGGLVIGAGLIWFIKR